jgi:hypothetical protein
MPSPKLPLALAAAVLAAACVSPVAPPGVLVASEPAGARVYVDGRDSGWVTPAYLDLGSSDRQQIDIVLEGFNPATVMVQPDGERYYLILWDEGLLYFNTWHFPLWLNFQDAIAPIKLSRHLHPSRIFVPLRVARPDG